MNNQTKPVLNTSKKNVNRNRKIALSVIYDHRSMTDVAKEYGLSRERVRQIMNKLSSAEQATKRNREVRNQYKTLMDFAKKECCTVDARGKRCYLYQIYINMLRRCYSESCAAYPFYGGRGITVDPLWLGKGGYGCFYQDVVGAIGNRPDEYLPNGKAVYSLDRVDNECGYTTFCDGHIQLKWSTSAEQAANRRPRRTKEAA
jgi:hypothetical protein